LDSILTYYHTSTIGELILGSFRDQLCLLDYRHRKMREKIDERIRTGLSAEFCMGENEVIRDTIAQVEEYLEGDRKEFELPVLMVGSKFQKSVWSALQEIAYGTTCSYLDLSRKLGDEKAIRAVAAANGANAISLVIPCHRVIGNKGELVGYGGGLPVKKRLLKLENGALFSQLELDL
jgi:methylated-DNA-[protein]-cysteine S-methyltransferase